MTGADTTRVQSGLQRLSTAAADGRLERLCHELGVSVLTVFGSAARDAGSARDLDVGALPVPGSRLDPVAVAAALVDLTGGAPVDLADLGRAGPLLRERALVGCLPLFEEPPGAFAAAQGAAIGERVDTDAGRRLDLELLRG